MSWLSKWHEQMLYFPNTRLRDGVDACVQALSVLNKYGYLAGKGLPRKELSYWKRLPAGDDSGGVVAANYT